MTVTRAEAVHSVLSARAITVTRAEALDCTCYSNNLIGHSPRREGISHTVTGTSTTGNPVLKTRNHEIPTHFVATARPYQKSKTVRLSSNLR
jgi:hypothetical protein